MISAAVATVRSGITEAFRRAVETVARKISSAMDHGHAGFPLSTEIRAIGGVAESIGNLEFRIEREQQRQTGRFAWIDVFFEARVPPATP